MENQAAVQRLILFVKKMGLSQNAFLKSIGASSGLLARINDISPRLLKKVTDNYPSVNPIWLMTGEGEMLIGQESINIAPNYGTAQQVGVGNQIVTADAEELSKARARIHELEKVLAEKEKAIARLEGKIELYKEMIK